MGMVVILGGQGKGEVMWVREERRGGTPDLLRCPPSGYCRLLLAAGKAVAVSDVLLDMLPVWRRSVEHGVGQAGAAVAQPAGLAVVPFDSGLDLGRFAHVQGGIPAVALAENHVNAGLILEARG